MFELCRRPNVTRALCPYDENVMCANEKANAGVEFDCETHEICSMKILGGPRKCDGYTKSYMRQKVRLVQGKRERTPFFGDF